MRSFLRIVLSVVVIAVLVALLMHVLHKPAPPPPAPAPAEVVTPPPTVNAHIYNEDADAKKDITGALALAQAMNKNVLLDFGANWCPDCQVLDIYMHQEQNSDLISKYYIPVHVDVGRMDKNLGVAFAFNVPISKGIPALAVVRPNGQVVHSQTNGEFNNMRAMQSSALTDFLNQWKPAGK